MIEELRELVVFAINDKTPKNKIVIIDKVTAKEAELIKLKTDLEVKGYQHIIDKSAINHTLKHHGKAEQEKLRGQIAVTQDDFLLIPEIFKTDNIIFTGKSRQGRDCILYQAEFDNVYYYIEEIRDGNKHLAMQSMYKRKRRSANSFFNW